MKLRRPKNYSVPYKLEMVGKKTPSLLNLLYIYLTGFDKRCLQKFQVRFNNLTLEVNKNQLKVAS